MVKFNPYVTNLFLTVVYFFLLIKTAKFIHAVLHLSFVYNKVKNKMLKMYARHIQSHLNFFVRSSILQKYCSLMSSESDKLEVWEISFLKIFFIGYLRIFTPSLLINENDYDSKINVYLRFGWACFPSYITYFVNM